MDWPAYAGSIIFLAAILLTLIPLDFTNTINHNMSDAHSTFINLPAP